MKNELLNQRRVLHIIDSFGTGGAETWLVAVVKYLKENPKTGIQFDFLASGGKRGIYDEEVEAYGSRIFYCKYSLKKILLFGSQFKRILAGNKYIAVHNHQDFISGWHYLSARKYLPPSRVSHLHNSLNFVDNYITNPLRWFSFKAGRLLMGGLASHITGTSNKVMDVYGYDKWPYKRKRVAPAYCGFHTDKFRFTDSAKEKVYAELGWAPTSKTALFVGRIGLQDCDKDKNEKNPEFAFKIALELTCNYPSWNFLFVGFRGKTGELLEVEAKRMGLQSRIKFIGLRNDIAEIMSASDIFVFPSYWEGLGMVAVEAQASGLPVLMSDTVPIESIVINDIVFTKSLSESAAEWANAIQRIANKTCIDRVEYNKLVGQSVFSIENSVAYLCKLYNSTNS